MFLLIMKYADRTQPSIKARIRKDNNTKKCQRKSEASQDPLRNLNESFSVNFA